MVNRSKLGSFGSKFLSIWLSSRQQKMIVHVDNAPAHNSRMARNCSEHNPLKRSHHPPYSPYISLGLLSFGKVKRAPIKQEIPNEISVLDAVTERLNGISTDELQQIFRSWIESVEEVITGEGGYAS
jgi:hypothetical protein